MSETTNAAVLLAVDQAAGELVALLNKIAADCGIPVTALACSVVLQTADLVDDADWPAYLNRLNHITTLLAVYRRNARSGRTRQAVELVAREGLPS